MVPPGTESSFMWWFYFYTTTVKMGKGRIVGRVPFFFFFFSERVCMDVSSEIAPDPTALQT